jgi:uncharacterized protein YdbL (DUF1318 family)
MPHNRSQQSAATRGYWDAWQRLFTPRNNRIAAALVRREAYKAIAWRAGVSVSRVSQIAVARGLARRKDAGVRRCCNAT